MSEAIGRESPLAQFFAGRPADGPADAEVTLTERPFLAHLNLRGDPSIQGFLDAAETVLGASLPLEPNIVAGGRDLAILWLGPDEWLVIAPRDRTGLDSELREALDGQRHALTDVSGGQTVVSLAGDRARDVLAKGCTLDLHPRIFGPGRCAQTLVAKANVAIWQTDDTPSYDLIVRRSFADYLAHWLTDASREYGMVVRPPAV